MLATMVEIDDGVRLRTWTSGSAGDRRLAVVLLHGGPGLPDYLAPVAAVLEDLGSVHRYDQRGTGGSPWPGEHTIARHVADLECLLPSWGHDRVILVGHSFGTVLASYFLLAHPERVAGLVQIAGPFLDLPGLVPWREAYGAAQRARLTRSSGPGSTSWTPSSSELKPRRSSSSACPGCRTTPTGAGPRRGRRSRPERCGPSTGR